MRTAIENNRVERTELIATDGRNYELISTPIKNPDGTISAVEIVTDITDRKQAEEALRESEWKLGT
jgi:PAS domain-containing protein